MNIMAQLCVPGNSWIKPGISIISNTWCGYPDRWDESKQNEQTCSESAGAPLSEGPVRSQDVGWRFYCTLLLSLPTLCSSGCCAPVELSWFQGEKWSEDHFSVTKRSCQCWWSLQNSLCLQETTVRPLKAQKKSHNWALSCNTFCICAGRFLHFTEMKSNQSVLLCLLENFLQLLKKIICRQFVIPGSFLCRKGRN